MGLLSSDSENNELILFSKWVKQNKNKGDLTQKVESISLSKSGEWILIKTLEALALLSAESKTGKAFWTELQLFSGQAKGLIIYPEKNKQGFDLDICEESCDYDWDEDTLTLNWKNKTKKKSSNNLVLKSLWEKASNSATIQKSSKLKNVSSTKQDKEDTVSNLSPDIMATPTETSTIEQ